MLSFPGHAVELGALHGGGVEGEGGGATSEVFSTPASLEFHLSVRGQAL